MQMARLRNHIFLQIAETFPTLANISNGTETGVAVHNHIYNVTVSLYSLELKLSVNQCC